MGKGSGPKKQRRKLLTVEDYRRAARERLTRQAFDYFRSGAEDERAEAGNEHARRRLGL